jgi:hypothetical protein
VSAHNQTLAAVPAAANADLPQPSPLHRLVLRGVTRGARVALTQADPVLSQALAAAGCHVHQLELDADAHALQALAAFEADVIVVVDGLAGQAEPKALLCQLGSAAPKAQLCVAFWNATSGRRLLRTLEGRPAGPAALSPHELRSWLGELGFTVQKSEPVPALVDEPELAVDAIVHLRQLFQQLNEESAHERLYWSAARTAAQGQPRAQLQDDLLTVVMRNHSLDRLELLDHAIFSLAVQRYQPLEIVVASQSMDERAPAELSKLLEKHQRSGQFTFQVVHEPAERDIRSRLLNLGVEVARGRYVAFLDDDDVVYPQHYERLIEAMQSGEKAWAVGRSRRALLSQDGNGGLYCTSKGDLTERQTYERAALVHDNFITCHSYVLDRARLGRFPVRFPEDMTILEDYVFLLQLSALFQPVFVGGLASCEYRIRDDGSNTTVDGATAEQREAKEKRWALARMLKDAHKRGLRMLVSMEEYERQQTGPGAPPERIAVPIPPVELRYRIADAVNTAVKRLGLLHRAAKVLAAWTTKHRG